MKSFLKKLGTTLLTVSTQVLGIGGVVGQYLPASIQPAATKVMSELSQISNYVVTVETVFAALGKAKAGGDKLKAATPLVALVVKGSELVAGKHIANPALFEQGCKSITSGMADVLNSLDEGHIIVVQTSSPVPPAVA